MIMRAYAFTGRSRKTLIFLSLCYFALMAVNIWVFTSKPQLPPKSFYALPGFTIGCLPTYGYGTGLRATRIIVSYHPLDSLKFS